MKEQELDRLLDRQTANDESSTSEMNFQKKIRKAINRTLYTRIFASLLIVALLGTIAYFAVSAAMNALFYHPGRESAFLTDDDGGDIEFGLLLESALSMHFPGLRCSVLPNDQQDSYTPTGFSGYDVDVLLEKAFDPVVLGVPPTHIFHIGLSKLDTEFAPFYFEIDEFRDPASERKQTSVVSLDSIQQELHNLPASAVLDISLSFEKYLTSDEVAALMHAFPSVHFQWIALKGQETSLYEGVAGGMSVQSIYRYAFTPAAEERYPDYYLPNNAEITGAQLEQNLRSRLQLLVDHPEFVSLLASRFGETISLSKLKTRLEHAENEWACYGLRLIIGRQDLINLMEQLPILQARINNVKVSQFQKP